MTQTHPQPGRTAAPAQGRGFVAATVSFVSTGSAIPSLIAGQASRVLSLPVITTRYAALAVLV